VLTATVKADESLIVRAQSEQGTKAKLGCVIGSNTFVASHVLLLPGVTVGDRCFIGSMLVLNKDVPDDTFVEVDRPINMRPNNIRIPKRSRLANFSSSEVISINRKYAAILLISLDGRLILQRRDSSIGTYNPGKLSAFGGSLEGTETLPECAIRELYEETGLRAKEEDLQFLVDLLVATDFGNTFCSLYALKNVNPANITISEGLRFEMFSEAEAVHQSDLTELCRTAILEYYKLR
jgi:8-oxo-dGTP pyrophosphatase MutT (NUDIX family)